MTQEQINQLWADYDKALSVIRNANARTPATENRVGETYKKLVNAGLAPKIKQKYVKVKHGKSKR